jgi:phage-related protein
MAGKTAILAVRILGDSTDATKALSELDASISKTEATTKKSGKNMAGVWTAVASGIALASKAASDLEQATGAVGQVFGEMAPDIMEWAEGMAAYGLSTAQAAQAAAIMGASLTNAGIPMEATAEITTQLIELGADMAAVFGGTVPQAVGALGAALRGEFDSLERYGITLTADAVAAEAMALSSSGVTFASEQQAKAVATLSLIQQQSTEILGAAAEESDTMAASTQQLKAEITNLAAAIGGPLNAVLGPLIGFLADLVGGLTNAITESEILTAVTDALAAIMETLADILDPVVANALDKLQDILTTLSDFIEEHVMPIIDRLSEAFGKLADAIGNVTGFVKDAIQEFKNLIDVMLDAIDTLTFWNDTYSQSPNPEEFTELPPVARSFTSRTLISSQAAPAGAGTVNITVQTGVGDPHAIAREIRRLLATDAARMGRRPAAI